MTKQQQEAGAGAIAIQSTRDSNIHVGYTADDVRNIIAATSEALLNGYTKVAERLVESRLADFQSTVLARFEADVNARFDAFADPDFIAVVMQAQQAHARSGDSDAKAVLVELIARRSSERDRTRLALSINQAIDKAAQLTHEEFAALSFVYLLRHVRLGASHPDQLARAMRTYLVPLLADLHSDTSTFGYLASQGLATFGSPGYMLDALLTSMYSGLFWKGIEQELLLAKLGDAKLKVLTRSGLIIPCLNDESKHQLAPYDLRAFDSKASALLDQSQRNDLWTMMSGTTMKRDEIFSALCRSFPEIFELEQFWHESRIEGVELTPIGIAIAHANLQRIAPFKAELSIWIR